MAENTKIEWATHTVNFWWGCMKVSEGCANCYAETLAHRFGKQIWGPAATTDRERKKGAIANLRKWNKQAGLMNETVRVFAQSMSDFFEDHPQLPRWRDEAFETMEACPNLVIMLLTKRPENIMRMVPNWWIHDWPSHVWIGTSVEDQKAADQRIPELLKIPARVRFLSMEPLLGQVNLYPASTKGRNYVREMDGSGNDKGVHWVIVGGESGHNARPMHPDWARAIRDQCVAAGVAFHFKQWGEWSLKGGIRATASTVTDFGVLSFDGEWFEGSTGWNGRSIDPDTGEAYMQKVGKTAAGRMLDGRTWDEFPE